MKIINNTKYKSLKYCIFSDTFNEPLTNLELSMTHLKIGKWFSQSVDHLPPTNVDFIKN